jgi:hypothetical protein
MPTVTLNSEQKVVVPRGVKQALAAAGINGAADVAQVSDGDRQPALLLVCDEEIVLVSKSGAQRWPLAQIETVGRSQILVQDGEEIPVSGWWYAGQGRAFRAKLRARIGQAPDETDVPPVAPPLVVQGPVDAGGLAGVVGVLGGIGTLALVASLFSWTAHVERESIIGTSLFVSALIGLPLLICSIKLASRDSKWRGLGVAGVVLGIAGTLVLAGAILLLIAISNCDGNCIGG